MSDKKGILVVAEPKGGKLANVTLESISRARALTGAVGGPVSVLIMGPEAGSLAARRPATAPSEYTPSKARSWPCSVPVLTRTRPRRPSRRPIPL